MKIKNPFKNRNPIKDIGARFGDIGGYVTADGKVVRKNMLYRSDSLANLSDSDLLTQHPFIWFSRKTWAGQQIERRLLDRGIRVEAAMEIDSLEAIDSLVRHGLGVAIVPDRPGHGEDLVRVPFCDPQAVRKVVMVGQKRSPKARLIQALLEGLQGVVASGPSV